MLKQKIGFVMFMIIKISENLNTKPKKLLSLLYPILNSMPHF